MRIFITAGEESGDILGNDLLKSLKSLAATPVELQGVGGSRMASEGVQSLFPMQELSLMGMAEIVPKIPHLQRRIRQTAQAIQEFEPDVIVTIDSPDFSFRVMKQLAGRGMSQALKLHYVAPTVWAWRPGRARKMAQLYDGIMCLLPFEPPYFEREGMSAVFVGHPMSRLLRDADPDRFRAKHHIDPESTCFGVLFGSREGEVRRMGGILSNALQPLVSETKKSCVIVPTLPHLKARTQEFVRRFECPVIITTDPADKADAFKACQVAAATSGTVGLELATLRVPHIIGYKMNHFTYEIFKRLAMVRFAHLGNIMLDRMIVPEFIQQACTSENMEQALRQLITSQEECGQQIRAFDEIVELIGGNRLQHPSDLAAHFILDQVAQR